MRNRNRLPFRAALAALPAAALAMSLLTFTPIHAHADASSHVPGEHTISVMKTPACSCCGAWVELARRKGYAVKVTNTEDYALMKTMAGVPEPMHSCHTTRIGGYTVEGHVPFAAVEKLMTEKPDIAGIAVPGMPMGSPGMGDDPDARFDVLAYGGTAKPGEVFFRAGIDRQEDVR